MRKILIYLSHLHLNRCLKNLKERCQSRLLHSNISINLYLTTQNHKIKEYNLSINKNNSCLIGVTLMKTSNRTMSLKDLISMITMKI